MGFEITASDVPAFTLGSSLLACGGGGNAYYGQLLARELLANQGPVRVIGIDEMQPEDLTVCSIIMGAPLVMLEKPPSLTALRAGLALVQRFLGARLSAFVAGEVGGVQSVLPLLLAAVTGKPLLDGDGMGRAFPEAQMMTFLLYGMNPVTPIALSDDHDLLWWVPPLSAWFTNGGIGGTSRLGRAVGVAAERIFRRYCSWKGGILYFTFTLDRPTLDRTLVRGSIRLALDIGSATLAARAKGLDPIDAILGSSGSGLLFKGKIVDVQRHYRTGHDWGGIDIDGLDAYRGSRAQISFKNEYLILKVDENVVLTVPDLTTIVETESATPVTTELLRSGLRVSVLGLSSSPLYRTEEALRVVGPKAFGYDIPFTPLHRSG